MERRRSRVLGSVILFIVLLAACGNGQQHGPESGLTAQATGMSSAAPGSSDPAEPPGTSAAPSETGQDMEGAPDPEVSAAPTNEEEDTDMKMTVQIGSSVFTATLEHGPAVDALAEMMEKAPVTIQMSDHAGFEKAGDIVLYQGDQIVLFYGANSWSYTRLGKIDDLTGWEDALGSGDITVTFSLKD